MNKDVLLKKFFFKLVLLSLICLSSAKAYEFTVDFNNGFYWPGFPLGMSKFVVNPSDGPALAGFVEDAEKAWESAAGRNLWNFEPGWIESSNFSGNYIRWSDNFGAETGYDPNQTLAITIRYTTGPYMTKTEVILNGNISALRNNEDGLLQKTILHEMGHTMGLDHSFEHAIMGAFASSVSSLQWDDRIGINAVIDEAEYRQATGYVSPLSQNSSTTDEFGTCGSVSFVSSGGSGGPGGGFGISLLLGLLLSYIAVTLSPSKKFARAS